MTTRRLAAILAADVAGSSRLMGKDEGGTLYGLRRVRGELANPTIASRAPWPHCQDNGDGLLLEFLNVVDAVRCAAEFQAESDGRRLRRWVPYV